jgi:hypothetical protein
LPKYHTRLVRVIVVLSDIELAAAAYCIVVQTIDDDIITD